MRQVRERLKGSIPALITPMNNGEIDEPALRQLIAWLIAEGSHGLVPCGTTGESPTLTMDEHRRVIQVCVEAANGRLPVLAGAGSNCTAALIAALFDSVPQLVKTTSGASQPSIVATRSRARSIAFRTCAPN